jgi:hypothetical protein
MEASFKTFRKKDNILAEFPSLELLVLLVQAKPNAVVISLLLNNEN